MSNYSDDSASVRVDFFKDSGKWYCTEAVKWKTYSGKLIHEAFAEALEAHLRNPSGGYRLDDMMAVCLEPYHEHAHPLMLPVKEAIARQGVRRERPTTAS